MKNGEKSQWGNLYNARVRCKRCKITNLELHTALNIQSWSARTCCKRGGKRVFADVEPRTVGNIADKWVSRLHEYQKPDLLLRCMHAISSPLSQPESHDSIRLALREKKRNPTDWINGRRISLRAPQILTHLNTPQSLPIMVVELTFRRPIWQVGSRDVPEVAVRAARAIDLG